MKTDSWSAGLRWGPRICIFYNFPGDAEAAGGDGAPDFENQ